MARTLDVSSSSLVSLRRARLTRKTACRVLQFSGGEPVYPRPLLWPVSCQELDIASWHACNQKFSTPDVHIHFVRNATVGGYGGHVFIEDRLVFSKDPYPEYVRKFVEQETSRWHWEITPKIGRKETVRLKLAYVISHFNPIYGHWLLEIMPKLFSIRELMRRGMRAPILLPSGYCVPEYVKSTIKIIIPDADIIEYDWLAQDVRLERAILPSMMNIGYVFNQDFIRLLDNFLPPFRSASGAKTIYISRSGLEGKFRRLENAHALDELSESMGLVVIRPETMSWPEQIRAFASARLIVGEFGSGMHNAIFSSPGTKVVCLNVVTEVQSRIANSFGHDIGYILDPDGRSRGFERGWESQKIYKIDEKEFESRIFPLVESIH